MTMNAALAPEAALRSTFGESVSGPVADIVVRNWGSLIALVGAYKVSIAGHLHDLKDAKPVDIE